MHRVLVSLFSLVLTSCANGDEVITTVAPVDPQATAATMQETNPAIHARFVDPLDAVLSAYAGWGRIDDEARWAPYLCRMPFSARAHVSHSGDTQTHGDKLYTLYVMDPESYGVRASMTPATTLPGIEQAIVKAAFAPEPYNPDDGADFHWGGGVGPHELIPAERDGQRFMAGESRGLYVMLKPEAATQGTDAGWVYATVAADMTTVTAVGVIESCAECHAKAGPGRLFGIADLPKAAEAGA